MAPVPDEGERRAQDAGGISPWPHWLPMLGRMAVAVFSVLTLNGCVPKAPSAVQAPQSTIPQAAPEMEPETRGGPHLQGTSSPVTLPTVQPTQCSLLAASPLEMLSTPIASYEIVNAYPHDPLAFTQGLLFADGFLYESTGLYGQSTVRQVNLETGEVVRETHLSPDLFGEGLTLHDGRLIQLTWQSRIGLVYNLVSFDTMSPTTFTYPTEGWGLTTDGHLLIMSDGTATLRYLHPMTFNLVREQDVWTEQGVVTMLNELEYVHGEIWANVWQTERIARIDPTTGRVKAWIDLSGLTQRMSGGAQVDVLNGIAHDADQDRIFVTGKLWPAVFEIRVVE